MAADPGPVFRRVLRRERRRAGVGDYADALRAVLADEPAGAGPAVTLGVGFGMALGLIATGFVALVGRSPTGSWWMRAGATALLGAVVGLVIHMLAGRRPTSGARDRSPVDLGNFVVASLGLVLAIVVVLCVRYALTNDIGPEYRSVVSRILIGVIFAAIFVECGLLVVGGVVCLLLYCYACLGGSGKLDRTNGSRYPCSSVLEALRWAADRHPDVPPILSALPADSPTSALLAGLSAPSWQQQLTVEIGLASRGGAVIMEARNRASPRQFHWIAASIATDSRAQVKPKRRRLLCMDHLVRPRPRVVAAGRRRYRIYGCGVCGATRGLADVPGRIVAVLDDRMVGELDPTSDGGLRVNWLARRAVGDFDHVEVGRVRAEEVEEFVMQVGNSTGRHRAPAWSAQPGAELTEESVRHLRSTFRASAVDPAGDCRRR